MPEAGRRKVLDIGAKPGRAFAEERADPNANVFDHVVTHIADLRAAGKRVAVAGWSEGSLDRLGQILGEHGLGKPGRRRNAGRAAEIRSREGRADRVAD